MKPARLVSRAEFARLAGVSPAAITKACRGLLKAARVGNRVHVDHPAAEAYLAGKGSSAAALDAGWGGAVVPAAAPTRAAKPGPKRPPRAARAPTKAAQKAKKAPRKPTTPRPSPSVPPPPKVPAPKEITELQELQELLRPLVERYGTSRNFRDWLLSLKDTELILAKHLANEEAMGRLISKELVSAHVLGALGGLTRKLLRDTPKTLARKVVALRSVEDVERVIREHIGSQIVPVKDKVIRLLRDPDEDPNSPPPKV